MYNGFPPSLAIVGTGLIGASLGKALLARGVVREVLGVGRSAERLETARQLGCVTHCTTDLRDVRETALVVVCIPVSVIAPQIFAMVESAQKGTIFTDVGSTKASLVTALQRLPNGCVFVGGHPIAGKETSGAEAADASLFDGKRTILTPTEETPPQAVETVQALWQSVGAVVSRMSAVEHDAILAATSHLPHILACVLAAGTPSEWLPFAGTGFDSMTRLAAGNTDVWRDILLDNRGPIFAALQAYQTHLDQLRAALDTNDDAAELETFLHLANEKRNALGN